MLQKVLAWSALALALLFVVLSLTIMFASGSLGASALTLVAPIAIGSLAVSILLAVAMLVVSLVQ
jgi:ABC-type Co2+ transport system permease subunit